MVSRRADQYRAQLSMDVLKVRKTAELHSMSVLKRGSELVFCQMKSVSFVYSFILAVIVENDWIAWLGRCMTPMKHFQKGYEVDTGHEPLPYLGVSCVCHHVTSFEHFNIRQHTKEEPRHKEVRRRLEAAAATMQHVSTFTLWPTSRNNYRNTYQYSAFRKSVPLHTLHDWTEAMLSIDASRITASHERQGPAEPLSCVLAEDLLSFIVSPLLRLISIAPAVWSRPRLRSDDGRRNEMWPQRLSTNCIDANVCISHFVRKYMCCNYVLGAITFHAKRPYKCS